MTKLPITKILVSDRQRIDNGDILDLANSLSEFGLIQPIVVNQENRLIAGGRRLLAAKHLGWTEIPVVFKETLSIQQLHMMELEENIRRKDMDWREKVLNIATIHNLRQREAFLNGENWTRKETGALLGIDTCSMSYNMEIAALLQQELTNGTWNPNGKYSSCENFYQAWQLRQREEIESLEEELASRMQAATTSHEADAERQSLVEFVSAIKEEPELLEKERQRYEANPHNKVPFEEYWAEKTKEAEEFRNTIYLSRRLLLGDSIAYMNDPARAGLFDHVITDIPYGIDIDNLDQHKGLKDIDTVEEAHDVDYNKKLIADFYPAAFKCTKEKAFVVTWADAMLWQYMYDCAIKAGFVVQRWPITWCKTYQCMNQCASYNTTKNTEIAIVARKKGTTLANQPQTSTIFAGKDSLCEAINHPFAKPFDCWQFLIDAFSYKGQTILEPFAGRGSGVISMLRLERNVIGVELEKTHYNGLLENVRQFYLSLNPNFIFK